MGVYRMKLAGRRKPVLLRAENKTDAIAALVEGKALTGEEVEGALADGLTLWKPGTPLPADDEDEAGDEETSVTTTVGDNATAANEAGKAKGVTAGT